MDCHECSNILYDYRDNELDGEVRREVESHLAVCVVCKSELHEIREAMAAYRSQITTMPGCGFTTRVMAKLDDKTAITVSAPLAALGILLVMLLHVGVFFLLPLFYPVLRVLVELGILLVRLPAIMLTAFPAMQFTSLSLLVVAQVIVTLATRRAILS